MPHDSKSKSGFTLVELAITLVVVGMLIGLGMGMIGPIINMTKLRETREILAGTSESINGWAIKNNRLPQFSNFTSVISHRKDSWGNPLIYLYDANLAPSLADATKDTICGRGSTTISLKDSITGSTYPDIAYIILSQGDNAAIDTKKSDSTTLASGPVTGEITADTANDVVKFVTRSELRSKVGCVGAPLKILNNELPVAVQGTAYNTFTFFADGGVPFTSGKYKWCIKDLISVNPSGYTLPNNLNPTPGCPMSSGCGGLGDENTMPIGWTQGDSITLNNVNFPTIGTYSLRVLVRDDNDPSGPNDNCAEKSFIITVK